MIATPDVVSQGHVPRTPEVEDVVVLGHRVRVATWPGTTAGPPLLMLNGIGARIQLLEPLAKALGDRHVVTFEFPGAGESQPPVVPYSLPLAAAFTARLLTVLGHRRVDVFGVSWGGMLAQQFAFQHPGRCRRLVLAATLAGLPTIPGSLRTAWRLSTPRRFHDPEYRRRIAGEVYGGSARHSEEIVSDLDGRYGAVSRRGYLYQQLALTMWSSYVYLPLLRQPTLIMAGDDDPIIPLVNARWMARMIPRCELRVLPDGHLFFVSDSETTAREMSRFLDAEDPFSDAADDATDPPTMT